MLMKTMTTVLQVLVSGVMVPRDRLLVTLITLHSPSDHLSKSEWLYKKGFYNSQWHASPSLITLMAHPMFTKINKITSIIEEIYYAEIRGRTTCQIITSRFGWNTRHTGTSGKPRSTATQKLMIVWVPSLKQHMCDASDNHNRHQLCTQWNECYWKLRGWGGSSSWGRKSWKDVHFHVLCRCLITLQLSS